MGKITVTGEHQKVAQKLIDRMAQQGASEINISIKGDSIKCTAKTATGTATLNELVFNGYREQTRTFAPKLSISERRSTAKRLQKNGHTQQEIADRLGVSQKTISNDLAQ